jgi:hypothetical protein
MRRFLRLIAAGAGIVIAASFATAQTPHFKTYRDPQYGVTFRYPAAWKADPKMEFYLGSIILGTDQPLMKVGFQTSDKGSTYPATTSLVGVEFVYLALPQATADACYARLPEQDGDSKKSEIVIHGVTYKRVQGADAGMGHGAGRDMYAAYLRGRCYLFEGGIHSGYAGEDMKPLTQKQTRKLQNDLAAVMQSVTISAVH